MKLNNPSGMLCMSIKSIWPQVPRPLVMIGWCPVIGFFLTAPLMQIAQVAHTRSVHHLGMLTPYNTETTLWKVLAFTWDPFKTWTARAFSKAFSQWTTFLYWSKAGKLPRRLGFFTEHKYFTVTKSEDVIFVCPIICLRILFLQFIDGDTLSNLPGKLYSFVV